MKQLLEWLRIVGGRHPRLMNAAACLHYIAGGNRRCSGDRCSLQIKGAFLRRVRIDVQGRDCAVVIDRGAVVENLALAMNGNGHKLVIGSDCIIRGGSISFEDDKCSIVIGKNTTIESADIAVTEPNSSTTIGEDCMLAFGVDIRNGDSHSIIDCATGRRVNFAKDVKIGNHVWLAAHVQILKGVSIGDGSVVGIRSVVTESLPANVVAAGIPSKIVKENICWERRRIYDAACTPSCSS